MKFFARITKLNNISGRAAYITDDKKQEDIVAQSEKVDWKPYQDFEKNNQKSNSKNNEGREIIIALPNGWQFLSPDEQFEKFKKIAETAVGKKTDLQWAVHLNKADSKDPGGRTRKIDNLHLHVVFSERSLRNIAADNFKDVKCWDRDIYHTKDGKVARSKAERAKDEHGNIRPPVHRKGEPKVSQGKYEFSAKDTQYKSKAWVQGMKADVLAVFRDMGVNIESNDPVRQQHEGKGPVADKIRESNNAVKQVNAEINRVMEINGGNLSEKLEVINIAPLVKEINQIRTRKKSPKEFLSLAFSVIQNAVSKLTSFRKAQEAPESPVSDLKPQQPIRTQDLVKAELESAEMPIKNAESVIAFVKQRYQMPLAEKRELIKHHKEVIQSKGWKYVNENRSFFDRRKDAKNFLADSISSKAKLEAEYAKIMQDFKGEFPKAASPGDLIKTCNKKIAEHKPKVAELRKELQALSPAEYSKPKTPERKAPLKEQLQLAKDEYKRRIENQPKEERDGTRAPRKKQRER